MSLPYVVCKDGVNLNPRAPAGAVIDAALVLASALTGLHTLITCGTEGHGPLDVHTSGQARDVRTRDWTPQQILQFIAALKQAFHQMTPALEWTVLYESPQTPTDARLVAIAYMNPNASASHLHIQLRKGTSYPPYGKLTELGASHADV